jgi:hypothetical protein
MAKVREAKNAYAMHDDPAVFLYSRGAIDALPGAKQKIFATLDQPRRAAIVQPVFAGAPGRKVGRRSLFPLCSSRPEQ